ncbi:MAG TPA: transposase [Candidatus Ligilactobacillus excrementigallinarum]|uniref:Transposase n=1 Tax=Candidatus Ligilactobacillus excrementigallinarum TaxID=2838641 RepID=A0A9D1UVR6_9LACO|nr:transposase [Candidatus Ligilactobacillus excrementigallinarum]
MEQRKLSRRYQRAKVEIEYDRTFKSTDKQRKLTDFPNYQKQKKKVVRLHDKICNKRNDYIPKITTDIVKRYDIIVVEDLIVLQSLVKRVCKNT